MTVSDRARHYWMSMLIVGVLYFILGFFTWLNGPLITFVKLAFNLNDVNAFLVPMAFYLSYFFLALPSSWILKGTGMKKGHDAGPVRDGRRRPRCLASSPRSAGIRAR